MLWPNSIYQLHAPCTVVGEKEREIQVVCVLREIEGVRVCGEREGVCDCVGGG